MRSFKLLAVTVLLTLMSVQTVQAAEAVRWRTDLQSAMQEAAKTNRLVLVHFWKPGCGPCARLDVNVFSQVSFANSVEANYVPVKINGSQNRQLVQKYQVKYYPSDVVLTSSGQVVSNTGCPQTTAQYASHLGQIVQRQKAVDNRYIASRQGNSNTARNTYTSNRSNARNSQDASQANRNPVQNNRPADRYAENRYDTQPNRNVQPKRSQSHDRYANRFNNPQATVNVNQGKTQEVNRTNQYNNGPEFGSNVAPKSNVNNRPADRYSENSPSKNSNPINPETGDNRSTQRHTGLAPAVNRSQERNKNVRAMQNSEAENKNAKQAKIPPIAIDGFCVMTLHNKTLPAEKRWARGDRRWGAIHQGKLYLFAGPGEQKEFLANPNRYAPVLAGHDPVLWVNEKKAAAGQRAHGLFYDDQIYLFASEATLQVFEKNPQHYVDVITQATRPKRGQNARR